MSKKKRGLKRKQVVRIVNEILDDASRLGEHRDAVSSTSFDSADDRPSWADARPSGPLGFRKNRS